MTERAFARVLAAFSAMAALTLAACGGGSGTGTLPTTPSEVSEQSTQTFGTEQAVPSVMYFSHEDVQRSAASIPSAFGQNVTNLPDGAIAHIMRVEQPGAVVPNVQANMTYHGGPIQKTPKQVLVLWGFGTCSNAVPPVCTNDANHTTEILVHFLQNVGGSHWLSVVTQYTSTAQGHITNPTHTLLSPVLIDTATAPLHPTTQDVVNASAGAEQFMVSHHILTGINKDVNYVVALGRNHNPSGFGVSGGFCAFHSTWTFGGKPPAQPFTEFPYVASAGAGCGARSVSGANDGVSIVLGHETAEAITDPLLNAWFDPSGNEIGDKCAFVNLGLTTLLNSDSDPVQPLWSNAAHACVRL